MRRFEQTRRPGITAGIAAALVAVMITDVLTPRGMAEWVFYLVPIVLSFLLWKPMAPVYVSAIATGLTVIGFFFSTVGVDASIAAANRCFAVIMEWALAGAGYQFIRYRLAVRKQDWLQTGLAKFTESTMGDPSMQVLAQRALGSLVEHTGAKVGAVYVESGASFHRMATYGVPAGANIPERFEAGDGLAGQVIRDRRSLVVNDVPEGYLVMGSSLGQAVPRHLLITPAVAHGRVNAVVELGFLEPVENAVIELLDRISEPMASDVLSAAYRTRLQELLEETQRQSEELQTQSEELRVNNEELEEQSRALKESQARLEQQQVELEQTNSQLEQQAALLESQKEQLLRSQEILEHRARELQQASSYKSSFLANMSHELRTPLNSSLILAKLLGDNREGNLTPEQVKFARTIESAGNDLLQLINEVLDLAKIEAGHMQMQPRATRVGSVVDSLRTMFQPLADQKQLPLRCEVLPDTPGEIVTDPQRLEQVLKNLLSNAIKFTERGEVVLTVNATGDGRVAFAVRDTGIGISAEQQQVIFEPFRQADGSTNRKYGGTGLGLSISRELVRLLGGELVLTSTPGQGSTFTVLLPRNLDTRVAAPEPAPAAAAAPQPLDGPTAPPPPPSRPPASPPMPDDRDSLVRDRRSILIVEDDEAFARIIADLAHELGFQVLLATTADEAVANAAQHLPSAVILDVGLPDHSGLSVLDRLKHDARTRHIPVHVVSGSDYAQLAYSMGAVGYMLKPVQREQLADALRKLESRFSAKMRRVLIVEDDATQRESIQKLLASKDVESVGVSTAAECLEMLRSGTFDCMVLDLRLPDASGFNLLETLCHEDKYAFPPVIVYTGRDLSAGDEQQLRKFAKSIIIKGARSPERLLDEVTLFLHQVVSELPPEQRQLVEKAHSRDEMLAGRRILVVEDDVRNVFALTSIFEPHGVKVQIARNGAEALAALEQAKTSGPALDLVLMDIMMPEMDGLTAMREIRKDPHWRKLPIIALTAKAMKNDQQQAIAAGANDYMAKPIDVDKLLSLARVWMPR